MLTRSDLQSKIISLICMLNRQAIRRVFVWVRYGNSWNLEITFTFREHIEKIVITKSQMPEVYDYYYKRLVGANNAREIITED